jgi:hypothetical protein
LTLKYCKGNWNGIKNKKLDSVGTKENKWIEVFTGCHKRTKQSEINHGKQKVESLNNYNMLYYLK